MQLAADRLADHLKRDLRAVYTVWGDEPLLAQAAADAIRAAARAAGCSERQVHTVAGSHFDWSSLLGASQALSLFADRQLVEIRIPSGKPGKDGSEALQRYCEIAAAGAGRDVITLVQLPRLDRSQQSSAWFGALDRAGITLRVDPDLLTPFTPCKSAPISSPLTWARACARSTPCGETSRCWRRRPATRSAPRRAPPATASARSTPSPAHISIGAACSARRWR